VPGYDVRGRKPISIDRTERGVDVSKQMLNEATFAPTNVQKVTGGAAATRTMTYGGTIAKTLVFLVITVGFALVGWRSAADVVASSGLWFFLGYMLLIALSLWAVANPRVAALAGLVYSVLMGLWMGSISRIYETYYDGIVAQAIIASVAVFLGCLLLYSVRAIRVTGRFVRFVLISISGIAMAYLFGWFLSIFGIRLNFLYDGSTIGIGVGLFVVLIAAFTLILDFAVIEGGVGSGAPREMEWYAAYGLLSTLVWLYLEVLYLLARTRNR
jgi:uncharacterized YccA/Bax inhibitor family protein